MCWGGHGGENCGERIWPEGPVLDYEVEEFACSPGPEELLKDF